MHPCVTFRKLGGHKGVFWVEIKQEVQYKDQSQVNIIPTLLCRSPRQISPFFPSLAFDKSESDVLTLAFYLYFDKSVSWCFVWTIFYLNLNSIRLYESFNRNKQVWSLPAGQQKRAWSSNSFLQALSLISSKSFEEQKKNNSSAQCLQQSSDSLDRERFVKPPQDATSQFYGRVLFCACLKLFPYA